MNERLIKVNAIKKGKVDAKTWRKWNESESSLQRAAEEYLQLFPNIAVIRIPDVAYRAIFASNTVPQRVKGMISAWVKGIPDLVLIKRVPKEYDGNSVVSFIENYALCIEFKVGKNKMNLGQRKFSEKANVIVVRSFEHFKELVDEFAA